MKKLLMFALLGFVFLYCSPAADARGISKHDHHKHHQHRPRHHHHNRR